MRRSSTNSSRPRRFPGDGARKRLSGAQKSDEPSTKSKARSAKSEEQGSVNLALALWLFSYLTWNAAAAWLRAQHVGIRWTTSLGRRPAPVFPRLGLLPLVFATYDPPLRRVRLLDARPSVTRLHAQMRKKFFPPRSFNSRVQSILQRTRRIRRFASAAGRMFSLKTAHSGEPPALPPARFNATSPLDGHLPASNTTPRGPRTRPKDRPAMRLSHFLPHLPDTSR